MKKIIRNKIRDYNSTRRSGQLPENEMLNFYGHLVKYGSFKEAIKFANYSRATLFRYIQRFKIIGIDEKSIMPLENSFGIPAASLDLRSYHIHINDKDLLRGIKITEASRI